MAIFDRRGLADEQERAASRAGPRRSRSALLAAFVACAPQAAGADGDGLANSFAVAPGEGAVEALQLGVGRSVIVDLPEDASEIFVGDPKVANAIVRSARRSMSSRRSRQGQTTIFALAADGRKIAVLDVSVGRDVGELHAIAQRRDPGQRHSRQDRRRIRSS